MKKIEAILQPAKFNEVQSALQALGVDVMTCAEVREFAPQNRHVEIYRSREHTVDHLPKIKMDLVVAEPQLEAVLKAIHNGLKSSETEATKVIVSDLHAPVEMLSL